MSYVPNYAQVVKNIDGNPKYPFCVKLREYQDDGLVASLEISTLDDVGLNRPLGEWFDPLELPLHIIRRLKDKL